MGKIRNMFDVEVIQKKIDMIMRVSKPILNTSQANY